MKTITKYQIRLMEADGLTARTKELAKEPRGACWLEEGFSIGDERIYDYKHIEKTITMVCQRRIEK